MDGLERMTFAQAVGEEPFHGPAFVAGVDFDPYDEDDVAAVRAAGEVHAAEYVRQLEEENAELREQLYGERSSPVRKREKLTPVPGATPVYDEDGNEVIDVVTCGHCERSWNDAAISAVTPAPSARCPFEYEHE